MLALITLAMRHSHQIRMRATSPLAPIGACAVTVLPLPALIRSGSPAVKMTDEDASRPSPDPELSVGMVMPHPKSRAEAAMVRQTAHSPSEVERRPHRRRRRGSSPP